MSSRIEFGMTQCDKKKNQTLFEKKNNVTQTAILK